MSYDWKQTVVCPEASIRDAIKVIDQEALRVALVVDEQFHLLGIVTDGDVRRGLLRQVSLEDNVSLVMNPKPLVCTPMDSPEVIQVELERKMLLHMPVVDNGCLVDLISIQHLQKKQYENPVFLMAGGFGTRLNPLTDNCPKPLLKVGDKPILEIILERFVSSGFKNIFISLHYMPEMVRDHFGDGSRWGANITYIYENTPLGTGGALGLLPKDIPKLPLIMMNGDVLTQVDCVSLLKFHEEHESVATMCVRKYGLQVPYGVIQAEGHKITDIVEKPVHQFFVNAGIYVLEPKVISQVDSNQHIDMPSLLESIIKQNEVVSMFPLHEYWLDIGQMKDFKQAQVDHARGFLV